MSHGFSSFGGGGCADPFENLMRATDPPQEIPEIGSLIKLQVVGGSLKQSIRRPHVSYYKLKMTQRFHNDPDNCNTVLP